MNPIQIFRRAAVAAVFVAISPLAAASPLSGSASGLASPAVNITFDEHVLDQNSAVTDQYADLGVTFSPYLYYAPDDPDGPYLTRSGNYLGNYADGSLPDPIAFVIGFLNTQTRAAFGMTSNESPWLFEALLDGNVVESFSASVVDAYYGFTGVAFNAIRVTSQLSSRGAASGDYMGLDALQFGNAALPAAVPEPGSIALLALGLVAVACTRRRAGVRRTS